MAGDRPRNLSTKFIVSNVDFNTLSPQPLASKEFCARGWQKIKNGYFFDIGSSSVKTVADRHRPAAYHYKHW